MTDPSDAARLLRAGDPRATALLESLSYRERVVVTRRLGLEGDRPESRERVAVVYAVTPNRIRQIEQQALKAIAARLDRPA